MFTLLILRVSGLENLSAMQWLGVGVAATGALAFTGDKLLLLEWKASGGDLCCWWRLPCSVGTPWPASP